MRELQAYLASLFLAPVGMLDRKLLRDLWRIKGQVIAIAFVVACGIATFVVMKTAMDSLSEARTVYYERYRIADIFAHAKRAPLSVADRLREVEGVAQIYPRIMFGATLDVAGMDEPATAQVLSVPDTGDVPLNALHLVKGRLLQPFETNQILLSEAFAVAHGLGPGDSLQAVINGHKHKLVIAGIVLSPEFVYSLPPGGMMPDDQRYGVIWMGRRALEAMTDMDGAFNSLVLSILPHANSKVIEAEVDALLGPYGGIDAYPKEDQVSYWFVENELFQLGTMGMIVPAIFLGVAAFLLNIVLARQVAHEREQIGMLKALGLANRQVAWHYMKFVLVIVVLGALIGSGLGAWLGKGLANIYMMYFKFPTFTFIFDFRTVAWGALISVLAAGSGAAIGMRRAVALPPAEAMRPAPPERYNDRILKIIKRFNVFSAITRMMVRHIERRPVRFGLGVIGVAMSVAIMIASMFGIDSMQHMIDAQYQVLNRDDVRLTFVEPTSRRALDESRHLPGVLQAEGFRSVPVRLVHGPRSHRTALTGYPEGAEMMQVANLDMVPIPLPDKGILLSEKLARMLQIGVGELIEVRVLEGKRQVFNLPISGLVQEYIGTNAYMRLDALHDILGEEGSLSGVVLQTTGDEDAALYGRVKDLPRVAGALLKDVAIASVEKTMTESIAVTMIINTLFGGLIAFGVIYNTARISMAERSRELASMRVLGFYRSEIIQLMLGELVILVALAIPVGVIIGAWMAHGLALTMDTELFRLPVIISPTTIATAALTVIVAAGLSALALRKQVQSLDIVGVLKTRE